MKNKVMFVKWTEIFNKTSIFEIKLDPRTEHLFMMSNPLPTFIITVFYALIVCYGPKIMKDREPFKLTNILIVYNFAITILSGYLVYEVNFSTRLNP